MALVVFDQNEVNDEEKTNQAFAITVESLGIY
jgi:hypothetical protein